MSEKSKRGGSYWILLSLVFLFIAYPLSIGPAVLLHDRGLLPDPVKDMVEIVYAPLECMVEVPVVGDLLETYVGFWEYSGP